MRVIKTPGRLLFGAALVNLAVPFVALQVAAYSRAPWWNLPIGTIRIWALSVSLMSLPLSAWLMKGRRWAFSVFVALSAFWVLISAALSIRQGNLELGLMTLVMTLFWWILGGWLKMELGRSFLNSGTTWYQSLPRPLPTLKCQTSGREFKVSRFDRDGVFIFDREPFTAAVPKKMELTFVLNNKTIQCEAEPMTLLSGGRGIGLRFKNLKPDIKKDLGDFVEKLRGEGYV